MSVDAVSFATPVSDVVPGRVFWLTGLSGAGKTTIGRLLWSRLRASGAAAVFLDGDTLRQIVSQDLGYDRGDRHSSAMRNSLTCRLLADQGLDVVCATISLFHDVQQWNRTHIPRYFEIFIHAPQSELERRDSKGIYAARRPGPAANVVGIDIEPELPREPDLILDNAGSLDLDQAVTLILEHTSHLQKVGGRQTSQRTVQFGTKAETLEHLAPVLKGATVLPQIRFSVAQWCTDRCGIIERIAAAPWGLEKLIVRSSAKAEDGPAESLAGKYTSISAVKGATQVAQAIDRVAASFDMQRSEDQVFVQPMLESIAIAGVAVNRDPGTGGPYFIINYDDLSGRTDLVTSGTGETIKTFFCLKSRHLHTPEHLMPVVDMMLELECLLGSSPIDVEFAVDNHGELYLLQVRRLIVDELPTSAERVDAVIQEITDKIAL